MKKKKREIKKSKFKILIFKYLCNITKKKITQKQEVPTLYKHKS